MNCPNYVAAPSFQLTPHYSTSGYDCTAHSDVIVVATSTCGAKVPSGRTIRLQTDEPIPDPQSPGLNLSQVARVNGAIYGVYTEVHTGSRKVTWEEYEKRRKAGQPTIIQVNYAVIADSRYDAGRGFRGGHAIAETTHATYDPLADGRAAGVFRFDGTVYDREIMKRAAGSLLIGPDTRPGYGYVWALFGRDVVPNYRVKVPAGDYWAYAIKDGSVAYRALRHTAGFGNSTVVTCTPPKTYDWGTRTVSLVRLTSGRYAGRYISAKYAQETP